MEMGENRWSQETIPRNDPDKKRDRIAIPTSLTQAIKGYMICNISKISTTNLFNLIKYAYFSVNTAKSPCLFTE